MKKSKKGFTLIELIVVLAILAVIAAIAVPTAFGAIEKAKIAADTASVEAYNSALRTYAAILRIQPDPIHSPDNTFEKAMASANIDPTLKPQNSGDLEVNMSPDTGNGILQFEVKEVKGTVKGLSKDKTFLEQLQKIATGADAPVVYQ